MALLGGADLVLRLPTPWSCARAQNFSLAAIYLMKAFGCVDMLSFGSECGNIDLIKQCAKDLRQGSVREHMRRALGEGNSFAVARQQALAVENPAAAQLLCSPNDMLNVEYLTAMEALGAKMESFAIQRTGAGHDTLGGGRNGSASELRIIFKSEKLPAQDTNHILEFEAQQGRAPVQMEALEIAWLARLRSMNMAELAALPDVSEGIEGLLYRAIRQGTRVEEILRLATGRRYPTARIRRILFYALLRVSAEDLQALPRFIQVIGHNTAGRELLHIAKTTATLPIVHRVADQKGLENQAKAQYRVECHATDLMALAMPQPQPCGLEERRNVKVV
jgi:predicted nucleotidyltransferase